MAKSIMSTKEILRNFCPPFMWKVGSSLIRPNPPKTYNKFHGLYGSFSEVYDTQKDQLSDPWTSQEWLDISRQKLENITKNTYEIDELSPSYALLALLINNLKTDKPNVSVLDWGGGTGFLFWHLLPTLNRSVCWSIVDNVRLKKLCLDTMQDKMDALRAPEPQSPRAPEPQSPRAPEPLKSVPCSIKFEEDFPSSPDQFDITVINTSLQYVTDQNKILEKLALYNPRYIVLLRLLAHPNQSFITCQNIHGYNTPCRFSNLTEIKSVLKDLGYDPILIFGGGQDLSNSYDESVPEACRVPYDTYAIFKK
jgi:SAM-dependent methyltransferase